MNKLFLLLLIPILAFGQSTTGFHRVNQLIARGTSGVNAQIVPNGSIYVTNTVTGATATIYSDPGLSIQITSGLVTSDKNGNYDYYIPLNYCVNEAVSSPGQGSYTTKNICINEDGGGSYPGVTSDGSNGLNVAGTVAAGTLTATGNLNANQVLSAGLVEGGSFYTTGTANLGPTTVTGNESVTGALSGTSASFSGNVAVGAALLTPTNATGICQAASARGFLLNGTDETATLLAQITEAGAAGKGYCLSIDAGKSLTIASLTIPNDGATVPNQIPIRITGATGNTNSHGSGVITSTASILNLIGGGTAKIISLGSAMLEIDHLALVDSSTNCVPFLLSTNTTINIHDNLFYGEHLNASACNDGIIIGGGTSTTYGGLVTSPNQGYVDQIWNNTFVGMRTLVHLNQFANAVNVSGNYNYNCGTTVAGTADGASAYELPNDTAYNVQGGTFTANHVEVTNYKYAFRCGRGCSGVTFQGNDTWDPTSDTLGAYYLQNSLNISVSSAFDNVGSNGAWSEVGPWVGTNTYNLSAVHTGIGDQLYASGGSPGIALQNTQTGTPLWNILTGWTNQYTIDFRYTTGGISPFVLTNAGVGTFLSYINATSANAFSGAVIAKGSFPGYSWLSSQASANPFTVNTGYTGLNTWSVYYNGGTDLFDLVGGTLAATFHGVVQAAGYKSSDGSVGYTGATGVLGCTVKNGLIVSCP